MPVQPLRPGDAAAQRFRGLSPGGNSAGETTRNFGAQALAEPAIASQYEGMNLFRLMHVVVARAFYGWALREIDPLHPDLPRLVLRQQELADQARRLHG